MKATGTVLADIEKTLRQYEQPKLADRVQRVLDSAAEQMYDHELNECEFCRYDSYYNDNCVQVYVIDYWHIFRDDATGRTMRAVTSDAQLRAWFGDQPQRYSYEAIEGRMKDWRGNDYYRGDRILYPRVEGNCISMTEAVYDEPIYAEGQEPKIIAIYAIPVNTNGGAYEKERVRLSNLDNITAVAA